MSKLSVTTLIISIILSMDIYSQHTINFNDNPAAGYVRATWYNSPAFFVIDNNGNHKYENDNAHMQNYLKYLGKNRWIQVIGQTYYIYNENLMKIDSIQNPYTENLGRMIDWHDVLKLANGHYLLLLFDTKIMDLSKIVEGGSENANVIGNMLVETDRTGKIYWEWSCFDHFNITDLVDYYDLTMNIIDFTHINSLQETSDGNILMSVRNFDEIVKINKSTGEVMWRIGGSKSKNNQYTFTNDTRNGFTGFSHQHSAQILSNGNLLLLDNGWLNPLQQTRGVEYQLDHTNKTATKVWEYFHPNGVFAGTMGSIEVLPNGNRFVNFGRKYITEVRPNGTVAWELEYFDGNGLYHATRVIEYMDAVYRNIGSIGNYSFINSDYNTGVDLQITSIQGQGDVSVERHKYLPITRKFEDTTYSELLPYRYVINQYGIQSINGKIKFKVSSIPELLYPNKSRLYWREKEGIGEFKEIQCTYNQGENVIEAQISKFGEFVIGVSILSKPTIIKPNEFVTTPVNVNFDWTKVSGARNYQIQISTLQNMTGIILDTVITNNFLLYQNFEYNTTYYWQVRAMNEKDTSQWSNLTKFTTQISSPVLVYPANQIYGVKFNDHLRWLKVKGADCYKIELATTPTFSNITQLFVGVTDTFVVIPPLKNNKRYYWRVFAIKGRDTIPTQMPFSFTTIMGTPLLSLPGNNEINISTEDPLVWNSIDGAELYLVQVSRSSSFDTETTYIDSTRFTQIIIKKLENEQYYYWKVRAVRTTDSSEWSDVYNFRTEMVIPIQYYPPNKIENIEVNPIFKWKENSKFAYYQLQVSKSSDFTSIIVDSTLEVPYYAIRELKTKSFFYWRVKAIDGKYQSSWSPTFMFKTGDNFIVQEPILVLPKHNSIADFPIRFAWTPSAGAIKYKIQISENSNFTAILRNVEVVNPEYIFEISNPKEYYYWRVKAFTTYDSSKWSDNWIVKPYNPFQKINLISPKNGELQVRTTDTLTWQSIIGADFYILEIATDKDFADIVVSELKTQTNKYIFSGFTKGKQYFWRVKCSIKDRENVWSNVWAFTIETNFVLTAPNNSLPKNNFIGFAVDGQLEWDKVAEARYYRLTIAKDTLFDEVVTTIITSNNYYKIQKNLDYSEVYYWRVAALSELANSKWSNTSSFTTELQTPILKYPHNMQTKVDLITEFSWNEVKDYKYFTLHIAKDKDFNHIDYNLTNIHTTQIQLKLEKEQTYFARIKSNNYENHSRWSETIIFSTGENIVSISDINSGLVQFYPNPVKSILTLINVESDIDVSLYDINGNKKNKVLFNSQINLDELEPGIYILKIGDRMHKLIKE